MQFSVVRYLRKSTIVDNLDKKIIWECGKDMSKLCSLILNMQLMLHISLTLSHCILFYNKYSGKLCQL